MVTEGEDAIDLLGRLLKECGLRITVSVNCVSGIVGRGTCRCWRCRGIEMDQEEPGWERAARLISRGHSDEVASWLRLRRFKENCPVCANAGRAPRCPGCGREVP